MSQLALAGEQGFDLREIGKAGVQIRALPNGCIYSIESGEILINQVLGSALAGGVQRIYLRVHDKSGILSSEIVGPCATSDFAAADDRFVWTGTALGLTYRCACRIHRGGDTWFFEIEIENRASSRIRCDVVMLQDIALATRGQARNNELFTSQYIDHFATRDGQAGQVVMSRQNLPQDNGAHPWLMQGCFPQAVGFTTDGLDFFGLEYKSGEAPAALAKPIIGDAVRQYEMAYVGLQGAPADIAPGQSQKWTFFAHYVADHSAASSVSDLATLKRVRAMHAQMSAVRQEDSPSPVGTRRSVFQTSELYRADELDAEDVEEYWPGQRRHEEIWDGRLASFFYGEDSRHVVLAAKERDSVRPHGHIMRAGVGLRPDSEVLSTTCYAGGVFASQMALGNSSLAQLLSRVRDPLNALRTGGMRIFMRGEDQAWELLGIPSAFEMGLGECRWIYRRGKNRLIIRCIASEEQPAFSFEATAEGEAVELLISGEISAGPAEFESSPRVLFDEKRGRIMVRPDPKSMVGKKQPGMVFQFVTPDVEKVHAMGGDELLYSSPARRGLPYVVVQTRAVHSFRWSIFGSLKEDEPRTTDNVEKTFWQRMTAGVRIDCSCSRECGRLADTLAWFARDAIVHLSAPRGLEQASGGAWGVRDVCQGPVEFLLSYGHHATVAEILRLVFSQQYEGRWDWPQWFMFPPFEAIQSPHCHGDVLIWPLKALCDYLESTSDGEILREKLPYTDEKTFARTKRIETVLEHVDRLIDRMKSAFLPGLSLPRYGDGDWDDSLQPADPVLRVRMVSSWTTELMYQALRRYATAMKHFGHGDRAARAEQLADALHADFHRHLVPGGVVAGFGVFSDGAPKPIEYLLHPSDTRTGLRYRLIPMTRGIISGIFSPAQAAEHLALIEKHLLFPDGARLMDRPTKYSGGVEHTFKRSESAASFGREIGLQYVHAHLRYAEALARMGRADELLRALLLVNPIAVTELVPGARSRQRNCYFSSSDAAFPNRYTASKDYANLRDGAVPTDGGWRIYSSGPGIYTSLVIRHLFGIRRYFDFVEFDPVLPAELNGATCELTVDAKRIRYEFAVGSRRCGPQSITVNGRELHGTSRDSNPYRLGGLRGKSAAFNALLTPGSNLVRIEL
jgi:1,2-beta-oligoglucan phosphorylase